MNTRLRMRKATEADVPHIRRIAHETWPVAYGSLLSPGQLSYMLELNYSAPSLLEQMGKGHQFYMAELDGRPFGFASVSDEGNAVFKLNKLYIIPDTQKTGAGSIGLLVYWFIRLLVY